MKKERYEELENYLHIINKVAQRHLAEAVEELEGKDIIITIQELKELIDHDAKTVKVSKDLLELQRAELLRCKKQVIELRQQLENCQQPIAVEGDDTDD